MTATDGIWTAAIVIFLLASWSGISYLMWRIAANWWEQRTMRKERRRKYDTVLAWMVTTDSDDMLFDVYRTESEAQKAKAGLDARDDPATISKVQTPKEDLR